MFDEVILRHVDEVVAANLPRLVEEKLRSAERPKDWLTEGEVAQLLDCSADTVKDYAMREEDPLPYGQIGTLRRYFRPALNEWLIAEGQRDRERRAKAKEGGRKLKAV